MVQVAAHLLFIAFWSMQSATSTVMPSIDRARSIVLPFHQRMLYAHAPPPQPDVVAEINRIIVPTTTTSSPNSGIDAQTDDQRVLQALLFISTGSLDAANDVVQRMSLHDAVYIHALLHRLEGKHAGEGGMKGWSNADYWNDQVGSYHPHYPLLCDYILQTCQLSPTTPTTTPTATPTTTTTTTTAATTSPSITERIHASVNTSDRVAKFVRQLDHASRSAVGGLKQSGWQPSLFLNLCMEGFRCEDALCVSFCESVTTYEYRLLLDAYCVRCLGVSSSLVT